jgi:uncharacterized YccA/Bax inhibitor family protein
MVCDNLPSFAPLRIIEHLRVFVIVRMGSAAEPLAMLDYIKQQNVTITIGVSFFVFGFFVAANVLRLSEREVMIGLISGAVCGMTMLVVSLVQRRRSRSLSTRVA